MKVIPWERIIALLSECAYSASNDEAQPFFQRAIDVFAQSDAQAQTITLAFIDAWLSRRGGPPSSTFDTLMATLTDFRRAVVDVNRPHAPPSLRRAAVRRTRASQTR